MMKETRTVEKIFQYVLLEQTEEKHFFSCVLVFFFLVSERTDNRKHEKKEATRERERETNEREKERERT